MNISVVPGENLGVKNYNWDKKAGYWVPEGRNCYNSYFYASEDKDLTVIDKFKLHGGNYVKSLDGGSALHLNLQEHPDKEQMKNLMNIAATNGTNYWTINVRNTECKKCGYISKHTLTKCPKCGSEEIDYLTRIIGYLKRESNFSESRQIEANNRSYLEF